MRKNFTALRRASLSIVLFSTCLHAQTGFELYISGGALHLDPDALVHVAGDVHLDASGTEKGILDNDGVLRIRGDFYIRNANVEQTGGVGPLSGSSTGAVVLKNYGYPTETPHSNRSQSIIILSGDALGNRAFYDLTLENDNRSLTGVQDNLVSISGGDAEIKHILTFNGDCRIRTDDGPWISTPPTGSDYAHELFVSNPDAGAISGMSLVPGSPSRYVEGRLRRTVSGTADYYFPIGLAPGFVGTDGMEAFELRTTGATAQTISTFLSSGITDLGVPQLYCDIGTYPAGMPANENWPMCTDGPDGLYDFAHLNSTASHEWAIFQDGSPFTYDLEVMPGAGLNATVSTPSVSCGGTDWNLRFLARDGELYTNGLPATVAPPPAPFNTAHDFPIGYRICPPATEQEGNTLTGLSGFSRFRLHGATQDQTLLPVELIRFEAVPVANAFIRLVWATASEVNSAGFELQRSTDAVHFQSVGWVEGRGTVADPFEYAWDDKDVVAGPVYYYRLRQVDFDGTSTYSPVDDARLIRRNDASITLYPNPAPGGRFQVTWDMPRQVTALSVLNALGQNVYSRTFYEPMPTGETTVRLPDAAAGTYTVLIYCIDGLVLTEKLIVTAP